MNHTQIYQLNQWVPSDRVLRDDFNKDNQKIEAALLKKCEIVFGSYRGDGAEERTISLDKTPKALLLMNEQGAVCVGYRMYGGIALPDKPAHYENATIFEIVSGGFKVFNKRISSSYSVGTNDNHYDFYYIAFY